MKKLFLIIAFIYSLSPCFAQLGVGYRFGYSSYKMSEMKTLLTDLQRQMKTQYPVQLSLTDNFPNYFTHYGEVTYSLGRHDLGINITSLSTAGRITYADYSGEFAYNLNTDAVRIGAVYRNHFYRTSKLSFFAEASPALTFNNITSDGYVQTTAGRNELDYKYMVNSKDISISVSPFVGTQWNLNNNFGLNVGIGYNIEIPGKIDDRVQTKVDWSGFRSGIGAIYKLSL